jgi:hypothetical protein
MRRPLVGDRPAIELDALGIVQLNDPELLAAVGSETVADVAELISGAGDNGYCGNNAYCDNPFCGNGVCIPANMVC